MWGLYVSVSSIHTVNIKYIRGGNILIWALGLAVTITFYLINILSDIHYITAECSYLSGTSDLFMAGQIIAGTVFVIASYFIILFSAFAIKATLKSDSELHKFGYVKKDAVKKRITFVCSIIRSGFTPIVVYLPFMVLVIYSKATVEMRKSVYIAFNNYLFPVIGIIEPLFYLIDAL